MKWGPAHVNLLVRGFEIDTFFQNVRRLNKITPKIFFTFNELDQAPSVIVKWSNTRYPGGVDDILESYGLWGWKEERSDEICWCYSDLWPSPSGTTRGPTKGIKPCINSPSQQLFFKQVLHGKIRLEKLGISEFLASIPIRSACG